MTHLPADGRPRSRRLLGAGILVLLGLAMTLGVVGGAEAQVGRISPAGKAQILAQPPTPFAGDAAADITIVEYLDFNCPYCRKAALTLYQLRLADPKVRILYKDWPIFGGVSDYAARAVLAAAWQGRYLEAHDALIAGTTRLASEGEVRDRLKAAGVDPRRLEADLKTHAGWIDATLARNDQEAHGLGFQGTPGMVVGDFVVPGALGLAELRELAAAARPPRNAVGR